jgi:glycosyltransferase involved in cell wall biosynthesis
MSKIKVLLYSDAPAPLSFTGYATVCGNIFKPLHQTGQFDIQQIGINYHGDFYDSKDCPWQVIPAKLGDLNDPYGTKLFLQSVSKNDYDIIWIINDTFVVSKAVPYLREIFDKKRGDKRKVPKIIYYYPVDSNLKKDHLAMIEFADVPVAYAKYGFDKTIELLPHLKEKLRIIHHGINTSKYFPYSKEIIKKLKKELFNLEESDYLIVNVNRNTMRKQLWRNLLALKEFRKKVPNSYLYLHTNPIDRNINLLEAMEQLNLKLNKDVYFPPNYSPSQGYPDEVLNQLVNCGDMFLTGALGEGYGLGSVMAMSCGIPFVGPDDSVNPEIFGEERGYLYPTKEQTIIDLSGLRKAGTMKNIVTTMHKAYNDGWKHQNKKVIKARQWAEIHDWSIINQQWASLFEEVIKENSIESMIIGEEI